MKNDASLTPLLEAKGVRFSYDAESPLVLDDVSLSLYGGEVVTLLGPNGVGKSTLLDILTGSLKPGEGEVILDGTPIGSLKQAEVARMIAYVPQNSSDIYDYEVREYVAMGRAPYLGLLGRPDEKDYQLVEKVMDDMGASSLLNKSYLQISGGERQMVNICRAVVQQPRLIVFDEPTAALDMGNQVKVLLLAKRLAEEGFAVLLTTHNPEHAILLGGRMMVLEKGGHPIAGQAADVLTQEHMSQLYQAPLRVVDVDEIGRRACLVESLRTYE